MKRQVPNWSGPIVRKSTDSQKTVLTTGEVAKICCVAPRTVSKWFDSGQLRGYRIPGSKDRRIPIEQLVRFMRVHGMPLNGLVTTSTSLVVLDTDVPLWDRVRVRLIICSNRATPRGLRVMERDLGTTSASIRRRR